MTEAERNAIARRKTPVATSASVWGGLLLTLGGPFLLFLIAQSQAKGPRPGQYVFEFLVVFALPVFLLGVGWTVWAAIKASGRNVNAKLDLAEGVYLRSTGQGFFARRTRQADDSFDSHTYHFLIYPSEAGERGVEDGPVFANARGELPDGAIEFEPEILIEFDQTLLFKVDNPDSPSTYIGFNHRQDEYELLPGPVSMDYTRRGHLLLQVKDAEGKRIYRLPDYRPE